VASGALTATGVAVDCSTGAAARRVAIYDGSSTVQSAYVADVSMDTMRDYTEFCTGPGSERFGFTVIFDTTPLRDGAHTLTLMAEFPNGSTETTGFNIAIANQPGTNANQPCQRTSQACNADPNTGGHYAPVGAPVGEPKPPTGLYGRPVGVPAASYQCDPFGGICNNNVGGAVPVGTTGTCVAVDPSVRCVTPTDATQSTPSTAAPNQPASNGASPIPVPCPSDTTRFCVFDGQNYVPIQQ